MTSRVAIPRHLLNDRVDVLGRDGAVVDGDYRGRAERVVARAVRCLIVTRDAGRLPRELVGIVPRGTSQVMLGREPVLRDGMVLQAAGSDRKMRRWIVRSPQSWPSDLHAEYQVAQLEDDPLGEVRPS